MNKTKANFVRHENCPKCDSSDGYSIYSDGHGHCFVCNHNYQPNKREEELPDNDNLSGVTAKKELRPIAEEFGSWKARGFSPKTTSKYLVTVGEEGNRFEAVYPFFNKDGQHVANKIRMPGKEFIVQGDWKAATLFGQQAFPAGSAKQITVTEGQDDAMAVYEMQGHQYPVVSVSNASAAKRDVANNFEYLNSFDSIVLCFDADEPGRMAADLCAGMFKPGKVRVMKMQDHKDANEYLLAGEGRAFGKEWWAAAPYTPMGLKYGNQLWDDVKEKKKYETVLYPYDNLNKMTYGIRLSEVVLLTAHTKVGKTTLLKEITTALLASAKKEYGVGGLFLEESNTDTALGLMSIAADKPLHLPDVRENVTDEELRALFDKAVNTDRLVLWDHFGSNTIDGVLDKIRHMHALGCKYIILDHLSIIVSDQSGDERKQLDEISTKLKMLAMELNIAVIAVIHQSRSGQIRGSAGPEQIANITIKMSRDLEEEDEWRRNVVKLVIQYNRFCGRTGPCGFLMYDPVTGRLNEMSPEDVKKYEQSAPDSSGKKEKWD